MNTEETALLEQLRRTCEDATLVTICPPIPDRRCDYGVADGEGRYIGLGTTKVEALRNALANAEVASC